MALITCKECGKEVSSLAAACPHCGAPIAATTSASIPVPQTQKKGGMGCNIALVLVIVVLGIVAIAMCSSPNTGSYTTTRGSAPQSRVRNVEYRVTGTTSNASMTYEGGSGSTEQVQDARLPWSKNITVGSGDFLYVSAQNSWDSGSVTCEIRVDGTIYKHATSQGGYAIVTCSGSAP